eukprot:CAMPEP_0119015052 /NCGR_PEP_ID=MMETSP1176-20130426/10533_1 /TAXON_ID=265551 /ORGANISM="Synedropsis recta cf, Strain CCMP1620" /LENGTH=76 /DNA_ID=CAMNT_0006968313 /DNA_START=184 /DNA_END=414 /DNA_ORIENTATION=+
MPIHTPTASQQKQTASRKEDATATNRLSDENMDLVVFLTRLAPCLPIGVALKEEAYEIKPGSARYASGDGVTLILE